ncbi:aminoglycoside 6-adenylyltransferase [Butyrivibrio sp. VCD2006]|uniref:aminoglycoside 6-adenylyltransferase n=1 Tax=Butyrivibrio sp. VCD2006 TaxID=1280664 RepID=UPI000478FBE2|nr:aminoglycoside 6-adenylyltransferase [Butyrivibrio sp. VCD2006]
MRSEATIIKLVLEMASADPSVRAVIRTNLFPKRKFQYSYEFFFVVNDIEKYENDIFKDCFGQRILLYRGDKNYPEMFPNTKAHLMVFEDGITLSIDASDKDTFLSRFNKEQAHENVWIGDTYKKLLDKDNLLPEIERLEETQTIFEEKPSEEEFLGTCNEFFWVLKTFSEYALRKELPSAMFYLNIAVRDLLNRMLRWHIYLQHGIPVDMGILDSNMEKLLEKDLFDLYKKTYPSADYDVIWKAHEAVVELWHQVGHSVANKCDFIYPDATEDEMLCFINALRQNSFKEI